MNPWNNLVKDINNSTNDTVKPGIELIDTGWYKNLEFYATDIDKEPRCIRHFDTDMKKHIKATMFYYYDKTPEILSKWNRWGNKLITADKNALKDKLTVYKMRGGVPGTDFKITDKSSTTVKILRKLFSSDDNNYIDVKWINKPEVIEQKEYTLEELFKMCNIEYKIRNLDLQLRRKTYYAIVTYANKLVKDSKYSIVRKCLEEPVESYDNGNIDNHRFDKTAFFNGGIDDLAVWTYDDEAYFKLSEDDQELADEQLDSLVREVSLQFKKTKYYMTWDDDLFISVYYKGRGDESLSDKEYNRYLDQKHEYTPVVPERQLHVFKGKVWRVESLLKYAESLPVEEIPVNEIRSVKNKLPMIHKPITIVELAYHAHVAVKASLDYPILLMEQRCVDGWHRIMKALMTGQETIKVKHFHTEPNPDYVVRDDGRYVPYVMDSSGTESLESYTLEELISKYTDTGTEFFWNKKKSAESTLSDEQKISERKKVVKSVSTIFKKIMSDSKYQSLRKGIVPDSDSDFVDMFLSLDEDSVDLYSYDLFKISKDPRNDDDMDTLIAGFLKEVDITVGNEYYKFDYTDGDWDTGAIGFVIRK